MITMMMKMDQNGTSSSSDSQRVAHDNLNMIAEIMMNDMNGGCCSHLLDNSNSNKNNTSNSNKSKVVETQTKKRRGRPPLSADQRKNKKNNINKTIVDDEDVCFICFDGGSLVLCDRRGCPKAYHPACIKRDEAFFQSKAKWTCGWHICTTCQKAASYYMCYTCPFSLCKKCTQDADYVSVRGNKGFCGICLRTILLIENSGQGSQESAQVDFDDQGSWEYLFKVYWVNLKGDLSITSDELLQARNPSKGDELMPRKLESLDLPTTGVYDKGLQAANPKRRKINSQPKLLNGGESINMDQTLKATNSKPVEQWKDISAAQSGAVVHNLGKQVMAWSMRSGNSELDRIWHYQDPSGKVQGPFSMLQLRRWSVSGHFPPYLRVWRVGERQDSSVLLTDALHGQYDKNLLSSHHGLAHFHSQDTIFTPTNAESYSLSQPSNCYAVQQDDAGANKIQHLNEYVIGLKCNDLKNDQGTSPDVIMTSNNGDNHSVERKNSSTVAVQMESKSSDANQHSKASIMGFECNDYSERIRKNRVDSQSSSQSAGMGFVIVSEQRGGSNSKGGDSQGGGNADSINQPHVPSTEICEECTPPDQMKVGLEIKNCKPDQINSNNCICINAESQINNGCSIDKQYDSEDYSSQSFEQSRRPPYAASPLDVFNKKSVSAANSCETSTKYDQFSVSVLSSPTTKPCSENSNDQGTGSRQHVSDIRIQDSGSSWCTASSQDCSMEQHKEITGEWSQCSPTLSKISEDLDCSLVSQSTLRQEDMAGDYAATSTSGSDQQRYSSESHHASNPSAWQEIVPEPNEFCCLVEESVSDLLAEVEAMESRNANCPGTPTSIMNCGVDLTVGSVDQCLSPGGTFLPVSTFSPPDLGKTGALSITGDMKLPSQSTVTDEPYMGYQTGGDFTKKFNGQLSHSIEVDGDARNSDVSVNQLDHCGVHPSPPSVGDCNISNTDTSWRSLDSKASSNNWTSLQDNENLSWQNLLKATEHLFGDL